MILETEILTHLSLHSGYFFVSGKTDDVCGQQPLLVGRSRPIQPAPHLCLPRRVPGIPGRWSTSQSLPLLHPGPQPLHLALPFPHDTLRGRDLAISFGLIRHTLSRTPHGHSRVIPLAPLCHSPCPAPVSGWQVTSCRGRRRFTHLTRGSHQWHQWHHQPMGGGRCLPRRWGVPSALGGPQAPFGG